MLWTLLVGLAVAQDGVRIGYGDRILAALGDRTVDGTWKVAAKVTDSFCPDAFTGDIALGSTSQLSMSVKMEAPFAVKGTVTGNTSFPALEGEFELDDKGAPTLVLRGTAPGAAGATATRASAEWRLAPSGAGWRGTRKVIAVANAPGVGVVGCFVEYEVLLTQ